jgi:hypothetical protein
MIKKDRISTADRATALKKHFKNGTNVKTWLMIPEANLLNGLSLNGLKETIKSKCDVNGKLISKVHRTYDADGKLMIICSYNVNGEAVFVGVNDSGALIGRWHAPSPLTITSEVAGYSDTQKQNIMIKTNSTLCPNGSRTEVSYKKEKKNASYEVFGMSSSNPTVKSAPQFNFTCWMTALIKYPNDIDQRYIYHDNCARNININF